MPLKNYSVLKGTISDTQEERDRDTPHFQIRVEAAGESHRIAVNVMSAAQPAELKYKALDEFQHPATDKLQALADGVHAVESRAGGMALDYVRGNMFDIDTMRLVPHTEPGEGNDLNDYLTTFTARLRRQADARIYAFGETWGPEESADSYFGFRPGNGIHDIHMNQGNAERWAADNGVYQDGGLLFHYPEENVWAAIFLAFQSQATHTDEKTGHPIGVPKDHEPALGEIRIVSALVNPVGDDPGMETITLLNVSDHPVDLGGWSVLDKNDRAEDLGAQVVPNGDCARIVLSGQGAQLSNQGGQLTLLTPAGLKAHGVSYSKGDAGRSGWSVIF
jgi:uncharacterized protein YukJ